MLFCATGEAGLSSNEKLICSELLPRLPTDGIFEIDSVMSRSHSSFYEYSPVQWYWKDDLHQWQPFNNFDSRCIEVGAALLRYGQITDFTRCWFDLLLFSV